MGIVIEAILYWYRGICIYKWLPDKLVKVYLYYDTRLKMKWPLSYSRRNKNNEKLKLLDVCAQIIWCVIVCNEMCEIEVTNIRVIGNERPWMISVSQLCSFFINKVWNSHYIFSLSLLENISFKWRCRSPLQTKGCNNEAFARHLTVASWGILSCHTYCNTGRLGLFFLNFSKRVHSYALLKSWKTIRVSIKMFQSLS